MGMFNRSSAYKAIVNALHEGIIVFDTDGRVLVCNPAAENILGMSLGQMKKRRKGFANWQPIREDGSAFPADQLPVARTLATSEQVHDVVLGNINPDRRTVWLLVNAEPVIDPEDGAIIAVVTTFTDITPLVQAKSALKENELLFHSIFDNALDSIVMAELPSRKLILANPAFYRMTGYSPKELTRLSVDKIHPKDELPHVIDLFNEQASGAISLAPDIPVLCKDGSIVFNDVMASSMQLNDRSYMLGLFRDATGRREAEAQQRLAGIAFDNAVEGIIITDAKTNIMAVNPAFIAITGYAEKEVVNQQPVLFQSDRHEPKSYATLWNQVTRHGRWSGEIWGRRKNGELFPVWLNLSEVRNSSGRISNYIGLFTDLTQIKHSEEKLERLTYYDPLTNLANRVLLEARLTAAISRARRRQQRLAVLLIGVDHFKNINDVYGLATGDSIIRQVAQRLAGCLGKEDTLARLGSDEIVVIIEELQGPEVASTVAENIRQCLLTPLKAGRKNIYLTASIGISIYPENGEDTMELLKNASTAVAQAKDIGRDCHVFYSVDFSQSAKEYLALETALRRSVAQNGLQLYYQPQVNLESGQTVGAEALLRWSHPELGFVSPSRFIPVAEASGLIDAIGKWTLQEACRQMALWRESGVGPPRISVNLSVRQIARSGLVDFIADTIAKAKIPAEMLELEITESVIMADPEAASHVLKRFAGMGIDLAIDDFGTGYSSLAYLQHFHIDRLKIDQTFIRGLPKNSNDVALCNAIIQMAKSLGLKVIAEGVETEAQRQFLLDAGCDIGQGYLFAKPLPAKKLEQWLQKKRL